MSGSGRRDAPEVRYERLHPAEIDAAVAAFPLAFLPIGTLEYHGAHLPFGVDGFEAHGLCTRVAERVGGVVLPPVYLASGCLDMPYTLAFELDLVDDWVGATIAQLARRGFRAIIVLTGHGPLDLNHLLKRVCSEAEASHPGLAAYALCWLELNAARPVEHESGEPTAVDHAALVETSWMLALKPELVKLDRLSGDPAEIQTGIYGLNPRFTASAAFGETQIAAAVELLAERARRLLEGEPIDPFADLRDFVARAWPERPLLRAGSASPLSFLLTNPGKASRYISALRLRLDSQDVAAEGIHLANPSPGERGDSIPASRLDPEHGFYLRRAQTATITLPGAAVAPGRHRVELSLGLGGVAELELDEEIAFEVDVH